MLRIERRASTVRHDADAKAGRTPRSRSARPAADDDTLPPVELPATRTQRVRTITIVRAPSTHPAAMVLATPLGLRANLSRRSRGTCAATLAAWCGPKIQDATHRPISLGRARHLGPARVPDPAVQHAALKPALIFSFNPSILHRSFGGFFVLPNPQALLSRSLLTESEMLVVLTTEC
jgi:hypothetical protein